MTRVGPLAVALLAIGQTGCGFFDHCTTNNGCGTDPGDVSCIPSSSCGAPQTQAITCTDSGAKLEIDPAPYFTISPNPPKQCQPFTLQWNVCNFGNATDTGTGFTVSLLEDAAPGNVPGINDSRIFTTPQLSPCQCAAFSYPLPMTGFYCNDPGFIPTTTSISATLPSSNGLFPATGAFTMQPSP